MNDVLPTSEVLNRAADILQERGWVGRGGGGAWHPTPDSTHPVCVEGALRLANRGWRCQPAIAALGDYLVDLYPDCYNPISRTVLPFSWNDRAGRTASEVIEALRGCAVIEASREREPAEAVA